MKAILVSIGDELLIGQTINTNASWLGQQLSRLGISISKVLTISDDKDEILKTFKSTLSEAELVIVTGGLGPTKDDITKHTLCTFFDTELEINPQVLAHVKSFFEKRNRPMLEVNIQQAALPKKCTVLFNEQGTAPGMWFNENGKVLISLPGVPYEMKGIFNKEIVPRLSELFPLKELYYKTILTQGIGESYLADHMSEWENEIRAEGLGLAYLPSPGMVKLRISSSNGKIDDSKIENYFQRLTARFPQHVYGREEETLSEVVGRILHAKNSTVGTIESCTGGGLANSFVQIAGSSNYFKGGLLTYSNELKNKLALVPNALIANFGAVSQEVVESMALNGRKVLEVDYAVSVSGIAGPDGGTEEKPVGTVWIAVADQNGVISKCFHLGDQRERNLQMSVLSALNFLRCRLLEINLEKK
jgi:nicotinamide-nucleotide amidase